MVNHLKNCLFGGSRSALAHALLLAGTLVLLCPPLPARPPGSASTGNIVQIVDDQGRRIYINAPQWDSAFGFRAKATGYDARLAGLVLQAADRHQMDPDLIHAVIRTESGYDPRAVSPKGAMGLMQLIPATARRFGVEDPFDPKQNIEGGTSYLKYLLGLFGGDLALSLAAYNAGENSVMRQGGVPPFPETEEYVRRVRRLYDGFSASNADGGRAREGNSAFGARASKPAAGKAAGLSMQPSAPVFTYVDARGVRHIEQ